mmetsp:Transcript_24076/g.23983  ORF Transcript_24076/g.23983 Transcript_24076/m.23983 type:complete len:106 (-) Transcript_24076:699-1016(-)
MLLEKRREELEEKKKLNKNSIHRVSSQDSKVLRYLKEKPRYQKMEKDFNETLESEGLLKKKKILASLRDLHQPINMREIEEEQDKYVKMIQENNEKKKQELMEKI